MRYLIKNKKEFIISLFVFATVVLVVFWAVWAIIQNNLSYENIIALIGAVFEMLGWYYNMPTSEENCRHTGEMRLEKEENNSNNPGEYFYDGDENIIDTEEENQGEEN